jgi:hypothetical protein
MSLDLSLLSPELLVTILQFLSSPRDLYTIIKTSSQFYRVFAAYKQSILSAILLNAIPSEIEADFILAYRAQRIRKFVPEHNKRHIFPSDEHARDRELFSNLDRESVAILDQFESRNVEPLCEVIFDRAFLPDTWIFYCNFEHFIASYSTNALLELQKSFYSSKESLSFTERTRLQRAFFRWEIYTCLFQISLIFRDDIRVSAPRFTAMLSSWEVEEISCVAQFYMTFMEELCDRIENDFVILIKEKMDAHTTVSGETKDEPEEVGDVLELCSLMWFDEYWKRSHRSRHNDYLVSRGIQCIRKLTSAPFLIVRRMVVRSDLEAKNKIPILVGLRESNPLTEREENPEELEERSAENDSDSECLGRCNFGWRWAVGNMMRVILYAPANYDLRHRGYVFWDKARLLESTEFQSPRDPMDDPMEVFKFPSSYQEHSKQPGVETKLKDFPVHWSVVDEISDEIDGRQIERDDKNIDLARDWKI